MSYNSVFIDSLVRIKNAQSVMIKKVELRFSGLLIASLAVLKDLGYIFGYDVFVAGTDGISFPRVVVYLKYYSMMPVIRDIKIFSKPGKRVFVTSSKIPNFYSEMGTLILSTNRGVLSGESARKIRVGGELLFGIF